MTIKIKAHFDGKVFIPDEPVVGIPIGVPLIIYVEVISETPPLPKDDTDDKSPA